jgi:hypothetical protein
MHARLEALRERWLAEGLTEVRAVVREADRRRGADTLRGGFKGAGFSEDLVRAVLEQADELNGYAPGGDRYPLLDELCALSVVP